MTLYTIAREFQIETEEKKSRFIAFLVPSSQFQIRLDALRKEHRKASRHVTAFRNMMEDGRIEEGAKDDGEPAGTSGMPILKVMQGENLIDCGIIVVRYFGGTKLGTGGLARAYSKAAKHVIEDAEKTIWHIGRALSKLHLVSSKLFRERNYMERNNYLSVMIACLTNGCCLADAGQAISVMDIAARWGSMFKYAHFS